MSHRGVLAAAIAVCAVAGCGGEPRLPSRAPLVVRARSGAPVDLSSTSWATCKENVPAPGASQRWRDDHGTMGAVTFTVETFAGPGCAAGAAGSLPVSAIAFTDGERTVGFTGTPPPGVTGGVVATKVYLDAGGAGWALDCYWVDDTASPRVLYTGDPNATRDADGFPNAFLEGGEPEL